MNRTSAAAIIWLLMFPFYSHAGQVTLTTQAINAPSSTNLGIVTLVLHITIEEALLAQSVFTSEDVQVSMDLSATGGPLSETVSAHYLNAGNFLAIFDVVNSGCNNGSCSLTTGWTGPGIDSPLQVSGKYYPSARIPKPGTVFISLLDHDIEFSGFSIIDADLSWSGSMVDILGDIDDNQRINIEDWLLLRDHLNANGTLSSPGELYRADLQPAGIADGVIDNSDLTSLRTLISVDTSDINNDNQVNIKDWLLLRDHLQNIAPINSPDAIVRADLDTDSLLSTNDLRLLSLLLPEGMGDLNDDQSVTISDLLLLQQHLIIDGLGQISLSRADLNTDGILSIADLHLLQRWLISPITAL